MSSSFIVPRGELPLDVSSTPEMANGVYRGPDPDTLWTLRSRPDDRSASTEWSWSDSTVSRSVDRSTCTAGGRCRPTLPGESSCRRVAASTPCPKPAPGGSPTERWPGSASTTSSCASATRSLVCGLFVVDRQSGERRQVPDVLVDGMSQYWGWTGTDSASVSPDGTAAVMFGLDGAGFTGAALLATDTGVSRDLARGGQRHVLGRVERRLALRRVHRRHHVEGLRSRDGRDDRVRRRRAVDGLVRGASLSRDRSVECVDESAGPVRAAAAQVPTSLSSAASVADRSERRSATRRLR